MPAVPIPPLVVTTKMTPDIAKCLFVEGWKGELSPAENHWAAPCRPPGATQRGAQRYKQVGSVLFRALGDRSGVHSWPHQNGLGKCTALPDNRKCGQGEGQLARSCRGHLGHTGHVPTTAGTSSVFPQTPASSPIISLLPLNAFWFIDISLTFPLLEDLKTTYMLTNALEELGGLSI